MDWLFGQLHGMFGNKLLDGFRSGHVIDGKDTGVENMKAIWAEKIRANGLKFVDVKRGLAGAERLKWPPTWGEFLDLCAPSLDVNAALHEAIEQMRARQHGKDQWSNAAVFWAAARIGEFDMISQSFAALKPRFEAALNALHKGGDIQPVPPRVPMLPAPSAAESRREYGRQRLDELSASEVIKNVSKGGNLNWAHRIIADERATGKAPLNKLNIARQAVFNVTGTQS
ncbi:MULTISPECIES: hypothetical protein [Paraburkholderia]|uniref:Uncharacterized protein n=1 Tax=Paraburkholderia podalyriae TaxID=1938811 RepID=A0ABR7PQG7_9BURK|nr:hypothetical protein [Paraburkholderia podalyriae]MBC8748530.1 hypothetical protein [Paraburkholderia podalyriae]